MTITEDFAFIIYAATFSCWMVAHATAWLNDDLPANWRWFGLLIFGTGVFWLFSVIGL